MIPFTHPAQKIDQKWPERYTNNKKIADSDLIHHYYNCVDQPQLVPIAIGIILFDEHGLILHVNQGPIDCKSSDFICYVVIARVNMTSVFIRNPFCFWTVNPLYQNNAGNNDRRRLITDDVMLWWLDDQYGNCDCISRVNLKINGPMDKVSINWVYFWCISWSHL